MLYRVYQLQDDLWAPWRLWARSALETLNSGIDGMRKFVAGEPRHQVSLARGLL